MSELAETLLNPSRALKGESTDRPEHRAAIYARTSSTSQRFGYSIDEQVRQCVERCRILDWTVAFVFKDEAVSGKDTNRPMFQQMLSRAEQGLVDVVVFWKLDRFSRSIMHAVQLEKQFREWGVALHSVTEQLDTTTPAGQFNFRNLANAAEFEREMIRQRTKMGHAARAMEGKWPNGTPPLGYELQSDGRLQIDEPEATLVRRIFDRYLETQSMPAVARELNQQSALKREHRWTSAVISAVLTNRMYVGEYSVGEVERVESEYEIVSHEVFEQATALRKRFQNAGEGRDSMPRDRRKQRIERVLAQYRGWAVP